MTPGPSLRDRLARTPQLFLVLRMHTGQGHTRMRMHVCARMCRRAAEPAASLVRAQPQARACGTRRTYGTAGARGRDGRRNGAAPPAGRCWRAVTAGNRATVADPSPGSARAFAATTAPKARRVCGALPAAARQAFTTLAISIPNPDLLGFSSTKPFAAKL
jgi:hypothetical protein